MCVHLSCVWIYHDGVSSHGLSDVGMKRLSYAMASTGRLDAFNVMGRKCVCEEIKLSAC